MSECFQADDDPFLNSDNKKENDAVGESLELCAEIASLNSLLEESANTLQILNEKVSWSAT